MMPARDDAPSLPRCRSRPSANPAGERKMGKEGKNERVSLRAVETFSPKEATNETHSVTRCSPSVSRVEASTFGYIRLLDPTLFSIKGKHLNQPPRSRKTLHWCLSSDIKCEAARDQNQAGQEAHLRSTHLLTSGQSSP